MLKTLVVPALVGLLAACTGGLRDEPVHQMGEQTAVGPLIYNVLETQWRNQLGDPTHPVIPGHRFLLVRLTIVNSGNQEVAVPLLHLVAMPQDDEPLSTAPTYLEVSDVKGVTEWLGLLRVLEGGDTLQGWIVFDVPPADYYLRVTDGGELDSERTALVFIPLTLDTPTMVTPPPASDSGL